MDLNTFKTTAEGDFKKNSKFLKRLKTLKPKELDQTAEIFHQEAFSTIDCLECANCCKTTSPVFYQRDIESMAKFLKMKPGEFIDRFLQIDEDGDYVLNSSPCPFLSADNYCSVYEARPKACREYPHTDRKKFYQVLDLTLKNTLICPAAHQVVKMLEERFR